VDEQVKQYMYQLKKNNKDIHFNKGVWYSTLQNIVQNYVMLDQAKIDSVTVSDDRVNKRINQRIDQAASQAGGEGALEKQMGKNITQLRASLHKQFKKQLTIQKYRQEKEQSIEITHPEVVAFFNHIPKDSIPTVPEKVGLSQIVAIAPPQKNALKKARHLAEQIHDSIAHHGKSFEKMAQKYSDGPAASKGGRIPMYPMKDLIPQYVAAASALKPGEISKVVKTSFGFHIIRLNKRRGNKIDTNNILISIGKNSYNKKAAIKKLNDLRDSIKLNKNVTFAEVARKKSDDPNTAPRGGRVLNPETGAHLLAFKQLDPALYRIVLLLSKAGDISKPEPFELGKGDDQKKAYRIIRLDQDIPEHTASLKDDYAAIKRRALQQKQYRVLQEWINDLEKDNFIEYKIPMPQKYTKYTQVQE
jgi:peptidyl-prolyl cis-trans isomerase SurA